MRITVVATGFDNRTGDALRSALDSASTGTAAGTAAAAGPTVTSTTSSGANTDNRYYDELLAILNKRK